MKTIRSSAFGLPRDHRFVFNGSDGVGRAATVDHVRRVQGNHLTLIQTWTENSDKTGGQGRCARHDRHHREPYLQAIATPDCWRNRCYIKPHKVIFAFASNQTLLPTPPPIALLFFMSYPRALKPRSQRRG